MTFFDIFYSKSSSFIESCSIHRYFLGIFPHSFGTVLLLQLFNYWNQSTVTMISSLQNFISLIFTFHSLSLSSVCSFHLLWSFMFDSLQVWLPAFCHAATVTRRLTLWLPTFHDFSFYISAIQQSAATHISYWDKLYIVAWVKLSVTVQIAGKLITWNPKLSSAPWTGHQDLQIYYQKSENVKPNQVS